MSRHYDYLLEDEDVRRWHDNLSVIWRDVSLRALGRFCETVKLSPKEFLELPDKKMADVLQDYIQKMLKTTNPKSGNLYAPGYCDNSMTAVKSWATSQDRAIKRKIRIENSDSTPTLEYERAPMPDELKKCLYDAKTDDRTRVSISLMSFSGFRPEVQGNATGTDGLRVGDFPEMKVGDGKVEFAKVPTMVKCKASLSKTHKAYFSFLNPEGCEFLRLYLERRMASGEILTNDSGIIVSNIDGEVMQKRFGMNDASTFLVTGTITGKIRSAMERASLEFRPYVWRSYCETHLLTASGRGIIMERYLKFLIGHKGDVDSIYSTNKSKLPDNMVEDMRSQYERASQEFLETGMQTPKLDYLSTLRRNVLTGLRILSLEEINRLSLDTMSEDEFNKLLESKTTNIEKPEAKEIATNGHGNRWEIRKVKNDDLDGISDLLAQGFERAEAVNGHFLYRRKI